MRRRMMHHKKIPDFKHLIIPNLNTYHHFNSKFNTTSAEQSKHIGENKTKQNKTKHTKDNALLSLIFKTSSKYCQPFISNLSRCPL